MAWRHVQHWVCSAGYRAQGARQASSEHTYHSEAGSVSWVRRVLLTSKLQRSQHAGDQHEAKAQPCPDHVQ